MLQMMRMIDMVVAVIRLHPCEDIVRGDVELCHIGRGIFSPTLPRIESIRGLVDLEFTEMPEKDMIRDNEFGPFRDFNLGGQGEERVVGAGD
jgi:hypothetical protein